MLAPHDHIDLVFLKDKSSAPCILYLLPSHSQPNLYLIHDLPTYLMKGLLKSYLHTFPDDRYLNWKANRKFYTDSHWTVSSHLKTSLAFLFFLNFHHNSLLALQDHNVSVFRRSRSSL
jgi:hypothetical protein